MNNKPIMNRGLKNRHIQLISLGGIIGSCYFLGTGYVLEQAGPASILAYLLGGIVVLCVMLCLAELAVAQPVSSYMGMWCRLGILVELDCLCTCRDDCSGDYHESICT